VGERRQKPARPSLPRAAYTGAPPGLQPTTAVRDGGEPSYGPLQARLDQEIVIDATVREVEGAIATVDSEARQGDTRLIRNAVAELEVD